jgi:RNA-directed DNA polymerase
MEKIILPQSVKTGIWRCLKKGTNPQFPEQGTPQGGCSALRGAWWYCLG